jgi:hypothetical protein
MNENRTPTELIIGIYALIKSTIEEREKTLYSAENHILEWSLIAASLVTSYAKTDYEIPLKAQSFCLDLTRCGPVVSEDMSGNGYELEWVFPQDDNAKVLTLENILSLMTEYKDKELLSEYEKSFCKNAATILLDKREKEYLAKATNANDKASAMAEAMFYNVTSLYYAFRDEEFYKIVSNPDFKLKNSQERWATFLIMPNDKIEIREKLENDPKFLSNASVFNKIFDAKKSPDLSMEF